MATELAHFIADGDGFLPTRYAQSHWGDDHLNGPALVGLAARWLEKHTENHGGEPDFMPARLTVDLVRAARGVLTTVTGEVVRDGRRVRSAQCEISQDGRIVARASVLQYRRSAAPPGDLWRAAASFPAPPPSDEPVLTRMGSAEADWSRSPGHHQNASRKRFMTKPIDVVAGEENSPFVRATVAAESTSLVTNLGTAGVGYINGDLTVGLARLPVAGWIGVQADGHQAFDGVAVGTATLFDEAGPFGSGMITAVANPAVQIDFSNDPNAFRTP
jgi:hypothetical protein